MGLFGRRSQGREHEGEAEIVAMAPAEGAGRSARRDVEYEFTLDVRRAADLAAPPGRVQLTCRVPQAKVPLVGQVVPVVLSGEDGRDVRIAFDRLPDLADRALAAGAAAQAGDPAAAAAALGFTLADPPDRRPG
jgi:hypothetical protein